MDLEDARQAAVEAARLAGELVRRYIGRPEQTMTKSSPHDFVTEVDKACQDVIADFLSQLYPESAFLGEEAVAPGSDAAALAARQADQRFLWVVDPIDGTLNFIRGLPACTVSIGLVVLGQPTVGVVYDPLRDEMFTGITGQGATLNGAPMRVSDVDDLSSALLASGLPTGAYRDKNAEQIRRFGRQVRNVRAFGSAALHLAYVAAGRLDGFWENDLNAWDLLGGAVLVKAAGGEITDAKGAPYSLETRHAAATNGRIHRMLLRDLDLDQPS